jgi:GMP synthase (glutamine-hydrolysing)
VRFASVCPPPRARTWLQVFRAGSALGVQFHPEATHDIYSVWIGRSSLVPRTTVTTEEALAQSTAADATVSAAGKALLSAWAAAVVAGTAAGTGGAAS